MENNNSLDKIPAYQKMDAAEKETTQQVLKILDGLGISDALGVLDACWAYRYYGDTGKKRACIDQILKLLGGREGKRVAFFINDIHELVLQTPFLHMNK